MGRLIIILSGSLLGVVLYRSLRGKPRRRQLVLLGLIALILFHLVSNYFWLKEDHYIPRHDENQYLEKSIRTYRLLSGPARVTLKNFLAVEPRIRPHLFPMCAFPFYFLLGVSYDSACLANSFFLAILILATFGIGRSLGGDRGGVLATFMVSFYPFVLRFSRFFWSEIPLMASFATALYLLIRTENFKSRGYSIGLGIVITAGLLIQQRFAFFIVAPLLVTLGYLIFPAPDIRLNRGRRLVNMLICLLIPTLLAVPYYLYYFKVFWTKFSYGITGEAWKPVEGTFTPQALFWYLGQLQKAASLFFFVLFVIAFTVLIVKRRRRYLLPLLTFAGGYLVITLYPGKDARYVTPLLPVAAVITAESWRLLRSKTARVIIVLLITLAALFNYLRVSWNAGPFNLSYRESLLELPFLSEPLELIPHR